MRETTEIADKIQGIKALATDIDGCVTSGAIYFGHQGDELKVFHTHDQVGIQLLRSLGWPVAVITARNSPMVAHWAAEQGVEGLYQGARSKVPCLEDFCAKHQLALSEVAYLGDDIWDLPAMHVCGLTACPADGNLLIRTEADLVLQLPGGRGALRELVDRILQVQGRQREALCAWYQRMGVADLSFLGDEEPGCSGPKIGFRR